MVLKATQTRVGEVVRTGVLEICQTNLTSHSGYSLQALIAVSLVDGSAVIVNINKTIGYPNASMNVGHLSTDDELGKVQHDLEQTLAALLPSYCKEGLETKAATSVDALVAVRLLEQNHVIVVDVQERIKYNADEIGSEMMCKVCGEAAKGVNYGVPTCGSCCAYFKRALKNRPNMNICDLSCNITMENRSCKYCRLRKCIDVGMSSPHPGWLQAMGMEGPAPIKHQNKSSVSSAERAQTTSQILQTVATISVQEEITPLNQAQPVFPRPNDTFCGNTFVDYNDDISDECLPSSADRQMSRNEETSLVEKQIPISTANQKSELENSAQHSKMSALDKSSPQREENVILDITEIKRDIDTNDSEETLKTQANSASEDESNKDFAFSEMNSCPVLNDTVSSIEEKPIELDNVSEVDNESFDGYGVKDEGDGSATDEYEPEKSVTYSNPKKHANDDDSKSNGNKKKKRTKPTKMLQCSYCEFSTLYSATLKRHENRHVGNKPKEKSSESRKKKERRDPSAPKEKHICEHCGFFTYYRRNIEIHVMAKHPEKAENPGKYRCPECPEYKLCTKYQLKHHIENHHNTKLICPCHGRKFVTAYTLRCHMDSEAGTGKYECPICKKRLVDKRLYKDHMNKHTGLKPYQCKFCRKTFAWRSGLRNHPPHCKVRLKEQTVLSTEGENQANTTHICPHDGCGNIFASASLLSDHYKETHVGSPITCQLCGQNFTSSHKRDCHVKDCTMRNDGTRTETKRARKRNKSVKRTEQHSMRDPVENMSFPERYVDRFGPFREPGEIPMGSDPSSHSLLQYMDDYSGQTSQMGVTNTTQWSSTTPRSHQWYNIT